MNGAKGHLTGVERTFDADEIIVSKTDTKGRITYANRAFVRVSGYSERELLGQPHNLIRHPEMPRVVFKLLWDTIEQGNEIFAYVVNRCKNGDHYWVFAHVTPTFDSRGQIVSYHSSRRSPSRAAIAQIKPIYAQLLNAERPHKSPREACQASGKVLVGLLENLGISYDEFIFKLARENERSLVSASS